MSELDLATLERQVGEWAEANFPDQPASYPLIGAGEEQGECTRSVLKRLQGIDDSDKYDQRDDVGDDAERDAVGDIVIYLADYFHRKEDASMENVRYESTVNKSYNRADEIILDLYATFGEVCRNERFDGATEKSVTTFLIKLNEFCEYRGYDLASCVADAWDEVSDREWDSNITR